MKSMFLPFVRFADFQGRSSRREFWMFFLLNILAFFASYLLIFVLGKVGLMASRATGSDVGTGWDSALLDGPGKVIAFAFLTWLALIQIPGLAVTIRRLHDIGKSGWWLAFYHGGYMLLLLVAWVFGRDGRPAEEIPGWALALGVVGLGASIIICMILIEFCARAGMPGPNRFGPATDGMLTDDGRAAVLGEGTTLAEETERQRS